MTKLLKQDRASILEAATAIRNGEIVAFPTETVYGLGAIEEALPKIYALKGRDENKPVALLVSSIDQVEKVGIDLSREFYLLAEKFFPGPLTLVVKKRGGGTIGVRMPKHDVALELVKCVGEPIYATSANKSGQEARVSAEGVIEEFGNKVRVVIEGKCEWGLGSTVVSVVDEVKVLREGVIGERVRDIASTIRKPNRAQALSERRRSRRGGGFK